VVTKFVVNFRQGMAALKIAFGTAFFPKEHSRY